MPTILFALVGSLIMNPFLNLFDITYEESATIPIYRIIYLLIMYLIIFTILLLLKLKNIKLSLFDFNLDSKVKMYYSLTYLLGL